MVVSGSLVACRYPFLGATKSVYEALLIFENTRAQPFLAVLLRHISGLSSTFLPLPCIGNVTTLQFCQLPRQHYDILKTFRILGKPGFSILSMIYPILACIAVGVFFLSRHVDAALDGLQVVGNTQLACRRAYTEIVRRWFRGADSRGYIRTTLAGRN